jgi:hypothetical protein
VKRLPQRHLNPVEDRKLTVYIENSVANAAATAASYEGFPYFVALLQVLLSLWTRGRLTRKLKTQLKDRLLISRANWGNAKPTEKDRRTFMVRGDLFAAASKRAEKAGFSSIGELSRVLIELYAQKRLGFMLRTGKVSGTSEATPDQVTDSGAS